MSFYSIAPFIERYYPEYYSIEQYPADKCIVIHKVGEEWGILSNFAHTPIEYNGEKYKSSEQLFQMMKFTDRTVREAVFNAPNPKMTAKHYEKDYRRPDWGMMIVDAMKLCLLLKYQQSEEFRRKLELTSGKFIVEDQTTFRKKYADTWGVKREGDLFIGPNLLGRLLMELRDNPYRWTSYQSNSIDLALIHR